jgi:hypothetical protein
MAAVDSSQQAPCVSVGIAASHIAIEFMKLSQAKL